MIEWTPDDWGRLQTAAVLFIGVGEGPEWSQVAARVQAQVDAGYLYLVREGSPRLYRATEAGKAALQARPQS